MTTLHPPRTGTAPGAHQPSGGSRSSAPSGGRAADRHRTPRVGTGLRRTLLALVACGLGAVPLKQLFRDWAWLPEAWLSMIVVLAPALLLRRRREPQPWHVWPGLVLLVPWLTLVFVPTHAWLHLVPTTGTWHDLSHQLSNLHKTTADEVAPIKSTPAARLVLSAMLGLLAALIDLIAVVGRRGALAGVPLLVVFTVAGAVPKQSVSWPFFVIGAIGFLLLLALDAEDDRRNWGTRIPRPGTARAPRQFGVSAQRVGVLALVAAVLIPFVLPAHGGNLIANLFRHKHGSGSGFGTGGGSLDPYVALKGELERPRPMNLFTVHLTQRSGSAMPFYARVNVLASFTGDGWRRGAGTPSEPLEQTSFETLPAFSTPDGDVFTADISVSGLDSNPPVFDVPIQVSGVGAKTRWNPTEQLLVGDTVSNGAHLVEQWRQPDPTTQELGAAPTGVVDPTLAQYVVRPTVPAYVTDLVQTLTRKADSPYAKALAINTYFTDPANKFVYSLQTKTGDSGSALVDFLKNKQGFCQQYAGAMGVMLRLAGIPARIVLGYTHPVPDKSGSFTVTTNDAHSWVEAYFQGLGWIPFDPTPLAGIDGGQQNDLPWARHPHPSAAPSDSLSTSHSSAGSAAPARSSTSAGNTGITTHHASGGSSWGWLIALLVVLAVVAAALVPAGLREGRRRRRIAAAGHRGDPDPLWAELADTAVDLGYVWSPARSPRQVAAWLRTDAASAAGSLDTLASAVEAARYGPLRSEGRGDIGPLSADLAAVSRELRARRSSRTRTLSRLWPASLGLVRRIGRRH